MRPTQEAYQAVYHQELTATRLATFAAKSDIAEQPWNRWILLPAPHLYNETRQGAQNRLTNAKEEDRTRRKSGAETGPKIDLWISMESGGISKKRVNILKRIQTSDWKNHYEDKTVIIVEKAGKKSVVTSSIPVEFPKEAWDRAKQMGFKNYTIGSQIEAISHERGFRPPIDKQDWYQHVRNGEILKEKDASLPGREDVLREALIKALLLVENKTQRRQR